MHTSFKNCLGVRGFLAAIRGFPPNMEWGTLNWLVSPHPITGLTSWHEVIQKLLSRMYAIATAYYLKLYLQRERGGRERERERERGRLVRGGGKDRFVESIFNFIEYPFNLLGGLVMAAVL